MQDWLASRCRIVVIALVESSDEFVLGYIQLLDGERDPRNLLVAFSSVRIILQNLHFGVFHDKYY